MISKRILLGTGALVAAIAPIATAISCGSDKQEGPEHPTPDPEK